MLQRPKLDTREARKDLTDRECAKLLGGTIGSLAQMADVKDIRRAVSWWASLSEDAFRHLVLLAADGAVGVEPGGSV